MLLRVYLQISRNLNWHGPPRSQVRTLHRQIRTASGCSVLSFGRSWPACSSTNSTAASGRCDGTTLFVHGGSLHAESEVAGGVSIKRFQSNNPYAAKRTD